MSVCTFSNVESINIRACSLTARKYSFPNKCLAETPSSKIGTELREINNKFKSNIFFLRSFKLERPFIPFEYQMFGKFHYKSIKHSQE